MKKNNEDKKEIKIREFAVEDIDVLEEPVAPGVGVGCTGKACTNKSWGIVCG